MENNSRQKKQNPLWVEALVLLLIVFAATFAVRSGSHAQHEPDDKAIVFPFRTVNNPDTQTLYAYELHKRRVAQDELPELCAIIKNVDPAKDDYKTYCKLVVNDIVRTSGTDKLVVYIYDSNEAYELYENKFLYQYKNLDTNESSLVDRHLIATYTGSRNNSYDYYTGPQLAYYENAHNGRNESETYQPGN